MPRIDWAELIKSRAREERDYCCSTGKSAFNSLDRRRMMAMILNNWVDSGCKLQG